MPYKKLFLLLFTSLILLRFGNANEPEWAQAVKNYYHVDSLSAEQLYGFVGQHAIRQIMHSNPGLYGHLAKILRSEPDRQFRITSPSGHFVIHYDVNGTHAVPPADIEGNGIPDFVDSAAVYLDHSWDVEINQLGFQPPLDSLGQHRATYPIYFTHFSNSGLYGLTNFGFNDEIPSLPGENHPSYIELSNDFQGSQLYTKGLDAMKVTCAHEFNHALQLGYRFWDSDTYFFEMTSTYLEEYIYPEVNDYFQYMSQFLGHIQKIRFTSASYPDLYANGIYLQVPVQRFGPGIVSEIWRQIREEPAYDALNTVLNNHGSSFSESQNEFGQWLYFTGNRAIPGTFFSDANQLPQIALNTANDFFVQDGLLFESRVGVQSLAYFRLFNVPEYREVGRVLANGTLQKPTGRFNHFSQTDYNFDSFSIGLNDVINPARQDTIILLVSNPSDSAQYITYKLTEDTLGLSKIGPNPIVIEDAQTKARFFNLPSQSQIFIINLTGRVVRTLINEQRDVVWDVKDRNGHHLESGVYFYLIKGPGTIRKGKFAVVRK